MLTLLAVAALQGAEPAIDFSGVQDPLGGEPTRVLVLGTTHLSQLPEDAFEASDLGLILERLEAFEPDIIAIEAVGGRICDEIRRFPHLYGEGRVENQYCTDPAPVLETLDMTQPEAAAAAFELLQAWPDSPSPADRRRLATFQFGAGEPWSAILQWRQLDEAERVAGDGVDEALAARLNRGLLSRNENNLIGAYLGAQLGHETLLAMDDHSADSVYARSPEGLWTLVQSLWAQDHPDKTALSNRALQYLGTPESVLAGYRFINSPEYQALPVTYDFGLAASTPDQDGLARQYVAWWQTRNLRMIANVIEGAGNQPGAKVLVIVGASHKPYFDAYLDQMHDIELVDVSAVLHD